MKKKSKFHPNNKHREGYNFEGLVKALPQLQELVITNPVREQTIDFSKPESVKLLNRALLKLHYGIEHWNIPDGYLCPPIPGRADYILNIADLLSEDFHNKRAKGHKVRLWDLGVGANCIYPLLAHKMYNWTCFGSDIDPVALDNAQSILNDNNLNNRIQLQLQKDADTLIKNLIGKDDYYDVLVCNPPFHESENDAINATKRKWKNLNKSEQGNSLNFGGRPNELWCDGGEVSFVKRLIEESLLLSTQIMWYSSIISKEENCDLLVEDLNQSEEGEYRIIPMTQGQKKSRILAWTHLNKKQRKAWINYRWS
jgi:23S rRNA (adenine1618-N6)-methyltransferase